jgi:hypothetical protein
MLAEAAVSIVASGTPGKTDFNQLQDPLQHQMAIDMMTDYQAEMDQVAPGTPIGFGAASEG